MKIVNQSQQTVRVFAGIAVADSSPDIDFSASVAKAVDWDRLDETLGMTYCPDNGRPAVSTRLMVALHYLKYTFNLSDEDVVEAWVKNRYWQYFRGMKYFEQKYPIDPSSMTRWRKLAGEAGAEELLKETIEAGLKLKAVKPHQLKRINVDTIVQEKEIRSHTDARLYDRARQRLEVVSKPQFGNFESNNYKDLQSPK